jgi:hypothetical protein
MVGKSVDLKEEMRTYIIFCTKLCQYLIFADLSDIYTTLNVTQLTQFADETQV